ANQSGEDNRNVARMSALIAGLPPGVGGVTVNRLCASGLQAIMDASRAIACNEGRLYIAGGVESMSRAPFVLSKSDQAFGRGQQMFDTTMGWRFINPSLAARHYPYTMGETAENVAKKWGITRQEQDAFALDSQTRYAAAKEAGRWEEEIVAVEVTNARREVSWVKDDEHPRATSMEALAKLKPAFIKDGTVTAGNSSGINDGAAALLLADEEMVKRTDTSPMARVVSMAIAGVDPAYMGIGPVPAVRKALQRAGLSLADIGLIELNEAFAAQSLACIRDLELDAAIVNVNGGAIAIGHPLGCSGARISTTLLYEMKRRKVRYGIATMCIGVGQGAAVVYENFL
ncbi:MAG TPA: acetyl-CoA C-acyltransferase, partial [Phnomibacter sp.]|nr:acetyl-CoA C-acyltransferase [Phnomibacter sp.]